MNEELNSLVWAIIAINCFLIIGVGVFIFILGDIDYFLGISHIVIGSLGSLAVFYKMGIIKFKVC